MSYKSDTCFSKHNSNPLTTYSNINEAKKGANHANREYNNDLIPYQCNKCYQFHLSPNYRNTKSIQCSYCTDGNGNNKDLYFSKNDAQQRADIIYEEDEISLDLYKCKHQDGWHLTKS